MEIIKINLKKIEDSMIDEVVDDLKKGKVVVLPTDTIYGLHCDAANARAVEKIYKIKQRLSQMPLVVLMKSYCMLHGYCRVTSKQDKYIRTIWPATTRELQNISMRTGRATTFIFEAKKKFPDRVMGKDNSLAVRLPKNELLIKILNKLDRPLISTSLNLSGKPVITDLCQLENYFSVLPDVVVDAGRMEKTKPSRIIDAREMNEIKIIRN